MDSRRKIILTLAFLIAVPWLANLAAARFLPTRTLMSLTDRALKQPPDVLAVGTSRMAAGLEPHAFDGRMMILAVPFMDVQILDMFARAHADLLKRSGRVYLEYHPEMLTIRTLKHQPEIVRSLGELRLSPWFSRSVALNPVNWQVGSVFPFLTQVRLTPRQILEGEKSADGQIQAKIALGLENGFQPRTQIAEEPALALGSRSIYREIKKYELRGDEEDGLAQFRALDAFLRGAGIEYCWLEMPKHHLLRTYQRKSIERVEAALAPILDEKRCLKPAELAEIEKTMRFADPNHLHNESAHRFSVFLRRH